jgi:hypothetical protein
MSPKMIIQYLQSQTTFPLGQLIFFVQTYSYTASTEAPVIIERWEEFVLSVLFNNTASS